MVYEWKQNRYPVSAQVAGEYLDQLSQREGGVLAEKLVKESEPEEAVLHDCFEWQDNVAARKYRESQARTLLKNLVTVNVLQGNESKISSFVSVHIGEQKENKRYLPISVAMNDEKLKEQVMREALNELNLFKNKYSNIEEFAKLFQAIDDLRIA